MLIAMIRALGYRFLADELELKAMTIGERGVWRLCSQACLWSNFVKKSCSRRDWELQFMAT
jgi:putative transposase